jgi:SAM-dependent methyltransferase
MGKGYITDVVYPRHFHRETMPVWMTSVLTALGRRSPDLTRPYTWLELGCGSGLSTVVAAATNPLGRFIGIDINAEAIGQARALAQSADILNANFHCLDFDQAFVAAEDQIPRCDFLVVHGVYSWISPDSRAAVQEIVSHKLKSGGVLYVSYLSHPGSASFAAARRLMRMTAQNHPGSCIDKVRAGLSLLQRMAQAGAGYFQEHPRTLQDDRALDDANAAFLAHEYLNEHWDALHVADVMADFAAVGCEYAGSAIPCENIEAASLPADMLPLLEELRRSGADAAAIETCKDLARYQTQRCDLYQRRHSDGNALSADEQRTAINAQRVCLLPAAPAHPVATTGMLTLQSRVGPVKLPMADVAPLLAALQDGPRSHAELASLPAYAGQPEFVNQALHMLAWAGWLRFLRPDHAPDSASHAETERVVQDLNTALVSREPPFNGPILAAAAIGSAIPAPRDGIGDARRLRWLGVPA